MHWLLFSLVFFALSNMQARAELPYLQEGLGAFEQGNYRRAFSVFFPLAQSDHADAQFFLGMMFDNGKGVGEDKEIALKWYRRAAEQGHINAQYYLGVKYLRGDGVARDLAQSLNWYRQAADQGDSSAQYAVAKCYDQGRGAQEDIHEAQFWYDKAAEQGHVSAQLQLGQLYFEGDRLPRDYEKAQRYWREASNQGSERAARRLEKLAALQIDTSHQNEDSSSASGIDREASSSNDDKIRLIRSIQLQLKSLGFFDGPADGKQSLALAAAIRTFQKAHGQTPDGQPSSALFDRLVTASIPAQKRSSADPASSGSGFIVSGRYVLTNHHVIDGCASVRVKQQGLTIPGAIAAANREDDIALIRFTREVGDAAPMRDLNQVRLGEKIFVVGYPLRGFLADDIIITSGEVNALAGPYNDRRYIQISAPVQNGNSGGPVFDASGNVIGMVVSSLNSIDVARQTGDIPQNVNFAIKASVLKNFLEQMDVRYAAYPSEDKYEAETIARDARDYTVMVECYK